MERLLITGASGFIGSWLSLEMVDGYEVFGTFLSNKWIRVKDAQFIRMDIRNRSQVLEVVNRVKPSVVVHIAGTKNIHFCDRNPQEAYRIHVEGTKHLAEACIPYCRNLVYLSTDCVFNGQKPLYSEDEPAEPFNIYGHAKYEAEQLLRHSDLNVAILRTSLVYGWCYKGQSSNTVVDVIQSLTQDRRIHLPTTLYNTPIYVQDLCGAIRAIIQRNVVGLFHAAGSERLSRYELGLKTAVQFDLDTKNVIPSKKTSGLRPVNSCLSAQKLEQTIACSFSSVSIGLQQMKNQFHYPPGFQELEGHEPYEDRNISRSL